MMEGSQYIMGVAFVLFSRLNNVIISDVENYIFNKLKLFTPWYAFTFGCVVVSLVISAVPKMSLIVLWYI